MPSKKPVAEEGAGTFQEIYPGQLFKQGEKTFLKLSPKYAVEVDPEVWIFGSDEPATLWKPRVKGS